MITFSLKNITTVYWSREKELGDATSSLAKI